MRADRALAGLHAGAHDGEAQSSAAGLAGARTVGAVERFENAFQLRFRDPGALIADGQDDLFSMRLSADPDRTRLAGVAQGIAHQIRHRPGQQFRLRPGRQGFGNLDFHPVIRPGFAGGHFAGEGGQIHRLEHRLAGLESGFGISQQFIHQTGHQFHLLAHILHPFPLRGIGLAFHQAGAELHPCQRTAQLVGDIAKETTLAMHKMFQPS